MPTPAQARQELARRELARRKQAQLAPPAEPATPTHPLESGLAKTFFPAVGGLLGGTAGTALGGAAGGIGAVPGMAAGAMTGAGFGEGTRQFLSGLTGGPRRRPGQAFKEQVEQSALEGTGMGMGRALPAAARLTGRAGRAVTTRLGSMATGVSPESIQRVFQRGAAQIVTPEFQAFAKGGIPERIQGRVIQGFDKFRTGAEATYDQAITALKPQIDATRTNLIDPLNTFWERLVKGGFLTEEGQPVKPLLGEALAPEAAKSAEKLGGILKQIQKVATIPGKGLTEVGVLPTEQAIRLKRELDTLLDFDPNAIQQMTKPAQAVLLGLRTSLREAIETAVPELAGANRDYHLFRDLYDVIQPKLRDPQIEGTLRQMTRNKNTFNFRMLSEVDQQLAPEERFLNQVLDALAGSEFGKDPSLFRFLPFLGVGTLGGGLPGGAVGLLAGIAGSSPRVLGAGLRGAEAVAKPLLRAGRAVPPTATAVAPLTLRALRQEAE